MFTCKVWNLDKFLKVIESFKVPKNPQYKSMLKISIYPTGYFFQQFINVKLNCCITWLKH